MPEIAPPTAKKDGRSAARRRRRVAAAALCAAIITPSCRPGNFLPAFATVLGGTRPAAGATEPERFSKDEAMVHVRALARSIGVRVRARRGERRAARYVAGRFKALGYSVNVQKFAVDGRTSRNVVAWWPGSRRYPVVIGAHIDTVAGSPGANDNASGVSIMLEAARTIAGREPAEFVRFVAFGSEEYGTDGRHHVGSQVFVNRLGSEGRRRLAGMVSVDMVARLLGRPLTIGTAGIGPEVVARAMYARIKDAGIDVTYSTTCDCSDNGPFERAGIPGSFMWSGTEPNYHSPRDSVRNLSESSLWKSGRALTAFLHSLDLRQIRRFRRH